MAFSIVHTWHQCCTLRKRRFLSFSSWVSLSIIIHTNMSMLNLIDVSLNSTLYPGTITTECLYLRRIIVHLTIKTFCGSVWLTFFSHATPTLFQDMFCMSKMQQSALGLPPITRRRVLWQSIWDVSGKAAAWSDLAMGKPGPSGASLCQCYIKGKSAWSSLLCLYYWSKMNLQYTHAYCNCYTSCTVTTRRLILSAHCYTQLTHEGSHFHAHNQNYMHIKIYGSTLYCLM